MIAMTKRRQFPASEWSTFGVTWSVRNGTIPKSQSRNGSISTVWQVTTRDISRGERRQKMKMVRLLIGLLAMSVSSALAQDATRTSPPAPDTTPKTSQGPEANPPGAAKCSTTGQTEITITCTYTAIPQSASIGRYIPRVVLSRAVLSLEPEEESTMLVELTFTNESEGPISAHRTLYLAIDDDQGRNYVRRALPNADFAKLKPGEPQVFSDHLRIGFFPPKQYTIHLWIPDPDTSLKFKADHNLLLSSVGVADPVSGLNVLAQFTVNSWKPRHKPGAM